MLRTTLILLALLGLAPSAGLAAPGIDIGQRHFDFGVVTQGERIAHEFEVVNSGDEDLVIERLTGS